MTATHVILLCKQMLVNDITENLTLYCHNKMHAISHFVHKSCSCLFNLLGMTTNKSSESVETLYAPNLKSCKHTKWFFSCRCKEISHVVLKKLKCGAFFWFIFPTVYHNLIESIRAAKWLRQMVTLLQS